MQEVNHAPEIRVRGARYSMPFSTGILVSSLLRAGMGVSKCYEFADFMRTKLLNQDVTDLSEEDLSEMVMEQLEKQQQHQVAENYRIWQQIRRAKLGFTILIGGVTGIGKSTVAKEVSYRLGLNSSIGTDSIRQVMRKVMSPELLPELHESTFMVHKHVKLHPMLSDVIVGFERQCRLVSVGVDGISERCISESLSAMVDGVHIVPGFFKKNPNVFPFILHLNDLEEHQARIHSRTNGNLRRPEKYLQNIDNIVQIQRFIKAQAKENDVPVIENSNIESSVDAIISSCITSIKERFDADGSLRQIS